MKGNWQLDAGDITHLAQIYPIGQGDNALYQSNLGAKKSCCAGDGYCFKSSPCGPFNHISPYPVLNQAHDIHQPSFNTPVN